MRSIFDIFGTLQPERSPQGPFKGKFHAYSPAFWNSENRDKLEKGDKIVVPASVLEQVSRLQVSFPIMFRITHDSDLLPKKSHCSVLEFTAEEGNVYLPLWMMDNLGLDPSGSSMVELETVSLSKGTFVQFQAHETAFAMLENPRVVLENALRSYSALTVGDTIPVQFNKRTYKLDVTDVKPKVNAGINIPNAISIIETDINVDFKEPQDYKQWEKLQKEKKEEAQKKLQEYSESKYADNEEEDADWVIDPAKNSSDKSSYFKQLEEHGVKPNTLRRSSSSGLRKNFSSNSLNNMVTSPTNKQASTNSYSVPSKTRGAPLGSVVSSKPSPLGNTTKQSKTTRKEEEVVGNMRYIYEVDESGNRTCVRKLPVRNNLWTTSSGHKLQ